jgi:hypothetical protein
VKNLIPFNGLSLDGSEHANIVEAVASAISGNGLVHGEVPGTARDQAWREEGAVHPFLHRGARDVGDPSRRRTGRRGQHAVRQHGRCLRTDPLRRRGLIAEGYTLLSYVLRDKPRSSLLRLYVKAVKQTELNSGPIGLFILLVKFPGMLRFIEPIGGNSTLAKRLKLAALLAESSAYGPYPQTKRVIRLMKLMVDLALDIVALPFRTISSL